MCLKGKCPLKLTLLKLRVNLKYVTIRFPPLELRYPGHGEAEAGGEEDGGEEEDQAELRPHAGRR